MAKVGAILDDRYEIVRVVGAGNMGAVYKAEDIKLNKSWAVKEVIKKPNDEDSIFCANGLRREAELMKAFDHPRIPRIVSIIENEKELQVVMDFMEGLSLDKILEECGPLPSSIVAQIGIQMCEALSYLHDKHAVIYRDMKPPNIMLTNPESLPENFKAFSTLSAKEQKEKASKLTAMLFDFGVASKVGSVSGLTPAYAPPENPQDADHRFDIYSLGATMFHLVTGYVPPEGKRPRPITEFENKVGIRMSTGLERIILKCTSENPDDRYANCDDLKRDLENYTNFDESAVRKLRRREKLFLVSAILTAVCLLGAFAGRGIYIQKNDATYDSNIAKAERENDEATSESYYIEAVGCDPSDTRAYEGLIELYKKDASFDVDESKTLAQQVQPNLDGVKDRSVDDYLQLCYDIGHLYWFYYDYGDSSDQQITRMTSALRWFEMVQETCEEENITFAKNTAVNLYCEIGNFYNEHTNKVNEAEDAGTYAALWSTLESFVSYLEEGNDQELMQWESYKLVVYALENFMAKFHSDGVSAERVQTLCEVVRADVESLDATMDKTQELRDKVVERLATAGAIERAYNANFG